ncbi:MAG: ATP-binding protein [Pseudonocardia sp.]
MFVGRARELEQLQRLLAQVRRTGRGELVGVRGRRQVGKSTLVEEFLTRSGVPGLFFSASKGAPAERELAEFARLAAHASSELSSVFDAATPRDWAGALRLLAQAITEPTVVVLDELPWLAAGDPSLEGSLQTAWDRYLSKAPVLLVALGSDLSMMERLGEYGRPLYQRMRELVLEPLHVGDTAELLGCPPAEAFDAQVVTGGFPRLLLEWSPGEQVTAFVARQLADSTSPLVIVGERALGAEFPPSTQARTVLDAIGAGATTFALISSRTGINQGSLSRTLGSLTRDVRVVRATRPLSSAPTRLTHYAVDDPYLRFWLRFIGPNLELLLRGRGAAVADTFARGWPAYRGTAVEPLVRRSIERMLPDDRFGAARHVGSFWTRTGDAEVDLVGADAPDPPSTIRFVGSVKWRETAPFTHADLLTLVTHRAAVPGAADVPLVGVARTAVTAEVDVALTAEGLLAAWD